MTYQIVLTTCPDLATAKSIATQLVGHKLAACVSIVPGLLSIYEWQGALEESAELLLLAKSRTDAFEALAAAIRGHHPYELPEIIAVPIESGFAPYLAWIDDQMDR